MRHAFHLLILGIPALAACAAAPPDNDAEIAGFQQAAQAFQQLYAGGSENCARIISTVAEDVRLVENGEAWGHAQLVEFCPHLPRKNVVDAWSDRTVVSPGVGYDFGTIVYENEPGAPRRETTVRVWRRTGEDWKIVRMSSVLSRIAVEESRTPEG